MSRAVEWLGDWPGAGWASTRGKADDGRRRRRSLIGGRRTSDKVEAAALAFLGGVMVGAGLWSAHLRRHSRALFNERADRRYAAIGFLRGRPSVDSARLLRDYIRWEPRPVLRRAATLALRRMEASLD